MKNIITAMACLLAIHLNAQTTLLHRKIKPLMDRTNSNGELYGPNDIFVHRTTSYFHLINGVSNSLMNIDYNKSYGLSSLTKIVFNRSNYISPVLGVGLNYLNLNIKQNDTQPLSGGMSHQRQEIRQWALPIGFLLRWNWQSRGYGLGVFSELGVSGQWNFSNVLFQKDRNDQIAQMGASQSKTYLNNLKYVNRYQQCLEGRIGFGIFAIAAKYRISEFFKASDAINGGKALPNFGKWSIGIEINGWNRKKSKPKEDEI